MDSHGRRQLVAGIILMILIAIALIGEAMHDRTLRNRTLAFLGLMLAALAGLVGLLWVLVALSMPGHAHDHHHPELNDWYKSLRSGHGPCCDGSDLEDGSAAILDDPDVDNTSGHYRVRIEGEWIDVDDDAVLNVPNRDGRAIVWLYHIDGHPKVRCFLPGAGT